MIIIENCVVCKHNREEKVDGWIPTCDAFPDGWPEDFDYMATKEGKECGNGVCFEVIDGEKPIW